MTQHTPPPPPPPEPSAPRRLTRSRHDRMIAGVCAGVAEYLDVDPTAMRIIAVLALIFFFPATAIAYVVMWMVVPEDRD